MKCIIIITVSPISVHRIGGQKRGGLFDLVGVAQNKSTICFYKNRSFAASSFLYFLSFKIFFVSFQIKVSVKDQSLLKVRADQTQRAADSAVDCINPEMENPLTNPQPSPSSMNSHLIPTSIFVKNGPFPASFSFDFSIQYS